MKIKQTLEASDIRRIWKPVIALVLALCIGAFIGIGQVHASCIALDDVPLDVQEQQAPGIVMFVLDDSGSMDWEYVVQGTGNSLFYVGSTSYYYIFANPGDNAYSGQILEGSANANRWKARWAGYNRLYYHPGDLYVPWPAMTDADPNNPRSNPAVSGNTLNLSAVYSDFGGITNEDIDAVGQVLASGKVNYWTGMEGRRFEEEFAAWLGRKHAIAVANGTVALELALYALGIGPGDEVITSCRTFIASATRLTATMKAARRIVTFLSTCIR